MMFDDMFPSKWLRVGHLEGKPRDVTIKGYTQEDVFDMRSKGYNKKWVVHFKEFDAPLILNATMKDQLKQVTGCDNSNDTKGLVVQLFETTETKPRPTQVIRIRKTTGNPQPAAPVQATRPAPARTNGKPTVANGGPMPEGFMPFVNDILAEKNPALRNLGQIQTGLSELGRAFRADDVDSIKADLLDWANKVAA